MGIKYMVYIENSVGISKVLSKKEIQTLTDYIDRLVAQDVFIDIKYQKLPSRPPSPNPCLQSLEK